MEPVTTTPTRETRSLLAVPVYVVLCLLLLSPFKEIIDPDDASYLKIAERYASGDWRTAVNGMWSPLNSWLGALFLKPGVPAVLLFKYLNIAFGVVALLAVRELFKKSGLPARYHLWAMLGLLPFCIAATYNELAADWLQCTLILLYGNLIFSKNYPERLFYPVGCGVLGALAFYAKYYNFHFFWLHFLLANFFWFYRWPERRLDRRFWSWSGVGIILLVVLALPWVFLLHGKYGGWQLNYTGAFDLAWSLDPALVSRHTKCLLPPTLPGAASYLEDPVWLQHDRVTPFSSSGYFARQVMTSAMAAGSLLQSLYAYSALLVAVGAYYLWRFIRGGYRSLSFERHAVLLCLALPSGYFLFHFEPRFLWPVGILGYILGWLLIVRRVLPKVRRSWQRVVISLLYMATFWVGPVEELAQDINRDDGVHGIAADVTPYHLQGIFIANTNQNQMMRLAYLVRMSLAVRAGCDNNPEDLMADILAYKVNYYFEFGGGPPLLPYATTSQLVDITGGKLTYLKIYRLQ